MDGELITVLGGGFFFVAAALGLLVYQRRKNAGDAEPTTASPPKGAKTKPKQKPNGADKPEEKKSLLASLSSIRGGDKKPESKKATAHKATKAELAELDGLIEAGHNDDAARLAMRLMQWDKAAQIYLKVEQPGNAAHCAKRAGKLEMAAELYEKAGDAENAAIMWEKSGNSQRARQVAGKSKPGSPKGDDDDTIIQISKELQKEIDGAIEKKDHMRAAELYEQAGDKENAAEQFATFAQTARRPEMYAEKIQALSPRVAYNLLRIATKGRPPGKDSLELHRRLAMLQHHFGNRDAAIATLKKLIAAVPDDEEAAQMLDEIGGEPSPHPDLDFDDEDLDVEPSPEPALPDDEVEVEPASRPAPSQPASSARRVAAPRAPSPKNGGASPPDEAVEAPKTGPSIADLVAMIGEQPCDLGNIEVYYRLGLACLAAQKVEDARRAFEAVDETSPGYRDTEKRLQRLS